MHFLRKENISKRLSNKEYAELRRELNKLNDIIHYYDPLKSSFNFRKFLKHCKYTKRTAQEIETHLSKNGKVKSFQMNIIEDLMVAFSYYTPWYFTQYVFPHILMFISGILANYSKNRVKEAAKTLNDFLDWYIKNSEKFKLRTVH